MDIFIDAKNQFLCIINVCTIKTKNLIPSVSNVLKKIIMQQKQFGPKNENTRRFYHDIDFINNLAHDNA